MADSKFLEVAKEAAIEAGKVVKKYYQSELTLNNKGHFANFATQADLEAESVIVEIITKNFPDHNVVGEESGTTDNRSEYSWVIDPIDGTIPFTDGLPFFAVSIGLLKNNKPFVGVINAVVQGDLYWAEEGKGAFKNGGKIQVSKEEKLEQSTFALEWGHSERLMRLEKHFKPIVEKVRYTYLIGSSVWDLVFVAEGNTEGSFARANVWDFAGAAILVQEAGGKLTDQFGNPPDFTQKKIHLLVSNGLIHDELVKIYTESFS